MYIVYIILRVILYPLIRFFLPFVSKKIKQRVEFEHRNLTQVSKISQAEYAFEVSSEGELEQIKPLLLHFLNNESTVELIYCSESVEQNCQKLLEQFPDQLRLLRMPLLGFNPFSKKHNAYGWLTAKTFFLCRYDFFPELIAYGSRKDVNFILLSAAAKNFSKKSFFTKVYLRFCYEKFNKVLAATEGDLTKFLEFKLVFEDKIQAFDFRVLTILERLAHKEDKIQTFFPLFNEFQNHILKQRERGILYGSFWNQETELFKGQKIEKNLVHCIVPHQLNAENIEQTCVGLRTLGHQVYVMNPTVTKEDFLEMCEQYNKKPGIWLFNVKGVLCEMYSYFAKAYVGGGYGESVHSVLEPFLAGCFVYCGPKVLRSSEFSLIFELAKERVVKIEKISQMKSALQNMDRSYSELDIDTLSLNQKSFDEVVCWLNFH